jgi:hypothetical protein
MRLVAVLVAVVCFACTSTIGATLYPPHPLGYASAYNHRLESDVDMRIMSGRNHLPRSAPLHSAPSVMTGDWFKQRVDHFSFDQSTFYQRYAVNDTYWTPGVGAPVFSMLLSLSLYQIQPMPVLV